MGPDIEGGHGLLRLGKRRSPCRVVRGTREENTGRGAGGSRRGSMAVCTESFIDSDIEGGARAVEAGKRKPLPSSGGRQRRIQGGGGGGSGGGSMAVCRDSFMDPDIEGLTPRIMPG